MSTRREGPNPLRPYYVPPSVGLPPDPLGVSDARGIGDGVYGKGVPSPRSRPTLSSSARSILNELDYSDYLSDSSPSVTDIAKKLVDQALWKYTSVLLGQPFEAAKTVLQCSVSAKPAQATGQLRKAADRYRDSLYEDVGDGGSSGFSDSCGLRSLFSSRRTKTRTATQRATLLQLSPHPLGPAPGFGIGMLVPAMSRSPPSNPPSINLVPSSSNYAIPTLF